MSSTHNLEDDWALTQIMDTVRTRAILSKLECLYTTLEQNLNSPEFQNPEKKADHKLCLHYTVHVQSPLTSRSSGKPPKLTTTAPVLNTKFGVVEPKYTV